MSPRDLTTHVTQQHNLDAAHRGGEWWAARSCDDRGVVERYAPASLSSLISSGALVRRDSREVSTVFTGESLGVTAHRRGRARRIRGPQSASRGNQRLRSR